MVRNAYKDASYFEAQIENGEKRREKFLNLLAVDEAEQARQADFSALYKIQLDKAISLYCLGAPIPKVKVELNKAWSAFIDLMNYSLSTNLPMMERKQFVPGEKISVFSLMILSDCDEDVARKIFEFTNSKLNYQLDENLKEVDAGLDLLTNEFAKYFGFESDRIYPRVSWPQLYDRLYDCFTAPDHERPKILMEYMDSWRDRAFKEDLFAKDAHQKPTNKNFRGYWSFLAGAVAKLLSIDDSALKDHPDYPYDLVNER